MGPPQNPQQPDEQSKKISVLLAEYNTLRTEVIAARADAIRAVTLVVSVMTGTVGYSVSKEGFRWQAVLAVVGGAVVYMLGTWLWNTKNTVTFTARIRELESEINARSGEYLLHWENDYGWGSVFRNRNPNHKGYTYFPKDAPKWPYPD